MPPIRLPRPVSSRLKPQAPRARDSGARPRPGARSAVVLAAGLSIGLHAAALIVLAGWVDRRPSLEAPASDVIRLTLAPAPTPPFAQPQAEPQTTEPLAPGVPDLTNPTGATPIERPVESRSQTPAAESPEEIPEREAAAPAAKIDLVRLREQFSTLQRESDSDGGSAPPGIRPPAATLPWAGTGTVIPGLPRGGGWLNPYVGPVQPRSETWGAPNGEQRGYFVLANGQAVCTRVAAPTNDELMNPWMSMRVTYMRLCGRVRGTAPPADDLDYAPAPAALRRPANAEPTVTGAVP